MLWYKYFLFFALWITFSFISKAQITHPKQSPGAVVQQEAGLTKITVDYSRPSVRGREVFGNLVPYGRIWRVGANESTKFTVTEDVIIMGNTLKAGTYALYAFPYEKEWEVVFHSNTTHWGDGRAKYNPDEDVFRIKVQPVKIKDFQETFAISFDKITHNGLLMYWDWAFTRIIIPVKLNTQAQMQKQLKEQINSNPTAISYYQAARFYQEQTINLKQALQWLDKAEKLEGPKYYISRVRSLIYAENGNYKKAVEAAKISLEIAESLGKDEFVRMNQHNIKKWSVKLIK